MDVVLREFEWSDLAATHALWMECFGSLKPEDEPTALRRTWELAPDLFLVALDGSRLVGTTLGTTDGRRGFLYHVAVAASHRRQGIARELVQEVSRRVFARGFQVVHLRVLGENEDAIAFYRALGFTADPPVLGMRLSRTGPPSGA
jgi:ribosomal protein S18 acetylase RimI-like enzyme